MLHDMSRGQRRSDGVVVVAACGVFAFGIVWYVMISLSIRVLYVHIRAHSFLVLLNRFDFWFTNPTLFGRLGYVFICLGFQEGKNTYKIKEKIFKINGVNLLIFKNYTILLFALYWSSFIIYVL